jgi:hypothetical protein
VLLRLCLSAGLTTAVLSLVCLCLCRYCPVACASYCAVLLQAVAKLRFDDDMCCTVFTML